MRPSSLRRDRQKQFNYMTSDEYEQELKKQVEEKKRVQQQEKMQNQQEILNHYKNYQLGGDGFSGEDPRYMKDLDQLVQNRERDLQIMGGLGGNIGGGFNEVFQGDMNAIIRNNPLGNGVGLGIGLGGGPGFDKKPLDLFSDNFVQNFGQQNKNNENHNIINSIFGNAIPSSIQSNNNHAETERERRLKLRELERMKRQEGFSGGDYGQVTELPGVSQQQQNQPQSFIQNNIFGGEQKPASSNASKRDQIWQQKLQQRLGSHEGQRQPNHQPPVMQQQPQNVAQMLPIYQNQGIAPISNHNNQIDLSNQNQYQSQAQVDANIRSSRVLLNLNDARKLDQSINVEKEQKSQPPANTHNNPLLGGDDDLQKKRRENEKKQRQQEYQEFLQKQNKGRPLPGPGPISQPPNIMNDPYQQQNVTITTAPTSSHSNQRPSYRSGSDASDNSQNVLLKGGLQQLGMNQQAALDEKVRKQREYKQMLDQQQQQKQNQLPPSQYDRKKELSDQIFAEVMSSSKQNFYQPVGMNPMGQQIPQMNRNQSAIQGQQNPKQEQDFGGGFMKNANSEDDQKRLAMEKKKEYAMQLQQQMALKQQQAPDNKRRRGTSQVVHQQQMIQDNGFQQQQMLQQMQKPVFEYQPPSMMQQQQQQQFIQPQMMSGMPDPYLQMQANNYGMMNDNYGGGFQQPPPAMYNNQLSPQGIGAQIGFMNPSSMGMGLGLDQPQYSQQQQQQPMMNQDPQLQARSKQEEYRRELEMQIKLKEEQKRQQQISQQLYDQKQDKDFAQLLQNPQNMPSKNISNPQLNDYSQVQNNNPAAQIMQGPPQGQNFSRQRTDVSKINDDQGDQIKAIKQQQYQEELQKQMEEKKRQKEEEKRKLKQEEEEHERKMKIEREILNERMHHELVKDGKRDPNAPYMPEKQKQVRRDQFEPSQDNPNAPIRQQANKQQTDNKPEWKKADNVMPKESLFGNDNPSQGFAGFSNQIQPSLDLPIQNRREDLFGGRVGGQSLDNRSQFEMPPPSYDPRSQYSGLQQQPSYGGGMGGPSQDRFGGNFGQPQPYQNNYNQPPSQQMNPMGQASVVDEQSKLIHMYQSALEQILQIKNQFYDQALQMNEKLIKEREQLLEYEKMKSQQNQEIQSLQAVYQQLGTMLNQRPISSNSNISNQYPQANPILNPLVQNNLNNLIQQQKADILRMSQSGGFNINQNNKQQQQQQIHQYPSSHYILPSVEEQPNILEQSLSSDTKFVNIQQNKLAQIAQQTQGQQLFQTWKQDQLNQQVPPNQQQQQPFNQSMMKSLAGTSQLVNNFQSTTPQKINKPSMMGLHSRPQTSTNPPETIIEMPKEEDDQVNQSKQGLSLKDAANMIVNQKSHEEQDFNSRESSKKNSPVRQNILNKIESKGSDNSQMATMQHNMITNTNPLGNTTTIQENMLQIDNILNNQAQKTQGNLTHMQQHQQFTTQAQQQNLISPSNKTQGNFHNQTGSSFYNQTLQHQKQQEQSQMEELQKQLMRIFGNTNDSQKNPNILEQMQQKPATPLVRQQQQQQQQQQYHQQQLDQQQMQQQYYIQQQQHQQQIQQQHMIQMQQQQHHQQQQMNNQNSHNTSGQFVNPLQRASYNEKLNTQNMSPDEKDILRSSNINIADSVTGTQNMQEIVYKANQKFSSNGFYANQYQFDNHQIVDETKIQQQPEDDINRDDDDEEEVKEIAMNDKPLIQDSMKYHQSCQNLNRGVEESTQHHDVWNDPDLIPPPVVMMNNDDEDDYYYEPPQINQSALGQYNQYTSSMIQDGTLKNLQMFSPPSDENDNNNYNLAQYESQNIGESQEDNQHYGSQFTLTQNNAMEMINNANQFNFGSNNANAQQQQMHPVFMETNDFQNQNVFMQQQEHQFEQSHNQKQITADMMSEKSVTKKERDIRNMMEVTKLIQKATDTTNTLFENSENFKFKIKRDQIKQGGEPAQNKPKQLQQQNSRKNIKTNDPFKNAESKLQNTTLQTQQQQQQPPSSRSRMDDNQSNINLAESHIEEEKQEDDENQPHFRVFEQDKDDDILSNLDKMIFNLQAQQQKCTNLVVYPGLNPSFGQQPIGYNNYNEQQVDEDNQHEVMAKQGEQNKQQQQRGRPFSGFNRPPSNNMQKSRSKSNKKNRPISAVDDQQKPLGKYAQMALQNNNNIDKQSQGSKKSLGRFAQMAIQNGINNPQIIEEVQQRYIGDDDMRQQQYGEGFDQNLNQQVRDIQHNILRPVSGKSNSTRYQQNHKPSSQGMKNRSGSRGNQQMFYDEESDDYTAQINYANQLANHEQYQQNQDYEQDESNFNIGYVRNEREAEME